MKDKTFDEVVESSKIVQEGNDAMGSTKFLNTLANKFEIKYLNLIKNDEPEADDLVVRKKKLKKKLSKTNLQDSSAQIKKSAESTQDDLDSFAIVSQDEIDKIK